MNHHESRGKGYLANDFSLIFPLATNNKLDPWKTSAACLKQQRRQCRPGHHRKQQVLLQIPQGNRRV